jgi:hypothetical protein
VPALPGRTAGPGRVVPVRKPRTGEGTAWLVVDRGQGDYLCYWYTGTHDGRLLESTRLPTAAEAVAWGRSRTAAVRIRTADGRTSWAGGEPRPAGFAHSWADAGPAVPAPSTAGGT